MSELKFPQWQRPLQELILERDQTRLTRKIEEVERLISLRFLRLQNATDCLDERQALTDALSLLRILKHFNASGSTNGTGSARTSIRHEESSNAA